MHWNQVYTPMGSLGLSAFVALLPIIVYLLILSLTKIKGYLAAVVVTVLAILVAVAVYGMPVSAALSTCFFGAATGVWPIGWIVVTAVFIYKVTVKSGHFGIVRDSISHLTNDRRLQALLIAFSFGAFLEGVAGFGAPVAIAGAVLVGLGFDPIYAAGLCLIADTAPVAFGAIGIPIIAVSGVTNVSAMSISQMVGRQLPLISLLLPFWLVFIMAGWKRTLEIWPALLISGGSFAVTQFLTSNYLGPQLPDVLSSLVSLFALALFLKVWQPKSEFHFKHEKTEQDQNDKKLPHTSANVALAWAPYIVLALMIVIWTLKPVKAVLGKFVVVVHWPGLDNVVMKMAPIVAKPTAFAAVWTWDYLPATGTAILIAAFISMFIVSMSFKTWLQTFGETVYELRFALLTIALVVAFGQLVNYSGMSASMALAFAKMGHFFPFVAPILGWIGVFLTGSDTSSNLLFGGLQKITAQQLNINPVLTIAANSSGGVMGKMISPQSISVGTSATGLVGQEGALYRFTLKHSLLFLLIICIITYLQAYFFIGMIPL